MPRSARTHSLSAEHAIERRARSIKILTGGCRRRSARLAQICQNLKTITDHQQAAGSNRDEIDKVESQDMGLSWHPHRYERVGEVVLVKST